ncbi:unnamed protein product [Adineta ricciae]|uniref:ADP ribosyltransferase domain-containing protein n=1 Tax=Adineta ricciae TaxID=249248 RepID=A0A815WQU2_ADIRI|nr:unnamed protein product [Adineta ricciae]
MIKQTTVTSHETDKFNPVIIQQVQDIIVVWLDNHIHSSNQDCRNVITQLQLVVSDVHTFTDNDQCIEFIVDNIDTEVYLLISGSLGQNIVPCIHDISNINSIFIFCNNQNRHERWAKNWLKVKSVSIDIIHICQQLRQIVRHNELNTIPMSFVKFDKRLDQLDPSFMHTQIIKEILLTIKFEGKHIKEFVDYYCDKFVHNEIDRKKVKQLESRYRCETPIWWYTSQRFLYGMLNRALRVMDGEVITLMGFFISDLHRHVELLHRQQFGDVPSAKSFTVYRAQSLARKDFDELVASKGGLLSFNNFLSTSKNRKVSLFYLPENQKNSDLVNVLFVMEIDPKQSTATFASVQSISQYPEEEEILFSMHSIFRIDNIKAVEENEEVYLVNLSLSNSDDEELRVLTEQIRKESCPGAKGWERLGAVLTNIGHLGIAERICRSLVNERPSTDGMENVYNQLGTIKLYQGQYEEAITLFEKSLQLQLQSLPSNHPDVASSYNNIGAVYSHMGEYSKALVSHEEALKIKLQSLPSNHPDVASSYGNIGNVYSDMGEYSKALVSYEEALKIELQSLPSNHPDVASSYNNIGAVYSDMGEYSKALVSHEEALKIKLQSLPSNHPSVASSYGNIGNVYYRMGEYSKALVSYEEALKIELQSLPSNHPSVASSYGNIGNVYSDMGEYSKALVSYEDALKIQLQSLPSNHPSVASSYNNIGAVYSHMGEYSKALVSHEEALKIKLQSLPSNHPSVASSYGNIGNVYCRMGEYSKALVSHEEALKIELQSLPSNHPDVASSYNNIGAVYSHMGEYSKALVSHEEALKIKLQSLPSNHPDVASSYNNIGLVYSHMGEYSKAYLFYKDALQIAQQVLSVTHPHFQVYKRNFESV